MPIPDITRAHVLLALEQLLPSLEEIKAGPHESKKYDLFWHGKRFPPKVVISHAVELMTGKSFPESNFSGGEGQANAVLERVGFAIIPKGGGELPLTLYARYMRKDIFALDDIEFSPQKQHLLLGLSPRCKDGGYHIFVTLNKEQLDPAHNYEDQLFGDRFIWVTRRDRGENHPDYVRLREDTSRVSLFVRTNDREKFVYCGELNYDSHREFNDPETGKVQQRYIWKLKHTIPDELLEELTLGLPDPASSPAKQNKASGKRSRAPSSFDEFKKAFSYAVDAADRTIIPAHQNYQVRLQKHLTAKGLAHEMERDFIDVAFHHGEEHYVGEIKVTTHLTMPQAFRGAIAQVLEYSHLLFEDPPRMIIFLDVVPDAARIHLATKYSICVVVEDKDGFFILNPGSAPASLQELFSVRGSS
jgi:hypothetical protein